ncbi:substrate-binding periplasmic protein [Marinigracilibium pacificum]|uniref:Transporter substrate-binding domain-containing protein n=1 Tax=Marinigracilibium pacificum TaxID=2729599 RepID=A0A848IS11_9BACT|nr:transporter substrate-binding domain-containing protein [Marinigracilibium pacificum]NMM47137.1 transporter substrate-binding domain-containing protein [Marinigracilibium pacificum]
MRFLKKSLWLFIITVFNFSSFGQTTSFEIANQTKSGSLEYLYCFSPGFINKKGGDVSGICVDILKGFESWVKTKYGITLTTKYTHIPGDSFSGFMEGVKSGGPGVIGAEGATITEKRKENYSFSHPFITSVSILTTHANVPTLKSGKEMPSTFNGMIALAIKGTSSEKALLKLKAEHYPNMKIEYLKSFSDLNSKIAENPKYYSIVDLGYFLSSMKQYRTIKWQPALNQSNELLGFIMPKDSDWAPILSQYIKEVYHNSSNKRQSIATHLGPSALRLLDSVGN